MSESFGVQPKPGSFVSDWVALRWDGPEDFSSLKRILARTSWLAQLDLTSNNAVITKAGVPTIEQWVLAEGYYVIRSPHDKIWVMDAAQFVGEFFSE